jgi:hypothetical protein
VELPAVLNYLALGTKVAQFDKPGKMALDLIPTYWKEVLDFPTEKHSLEDVWKSVWKCNLSP